MNNEKREWDAYFGISGIIIIIGSFILSIIDNTYAFIGLCGFAIGCILIVIGVVIKKSRDMEETNIVEKNKKDMSEWFDYKIKEYGINTDKILYRGYRYYYWVKDGKFFFFPHKEDFIRWHVSLSSSVNYCEEHATLECIDILDIEYFKIVGSISYVTNVESTGINLKGAAIGAVVAGEAGAIIGSRPQIKSQVKGKDDRHIELKFKCNGGLKTIEFDYTALDIFRNIFPEKEYEYAEFKVKNLDEKDDEIEMDFTLEERFEKLKRLKNAGLITEEEFTDKKKELLQQI